MFVASIKTPTMEPYCRVLGALNVMFVLLSILLFTFGLLIRESFYGRSSLLSSYVNVPATVTMSFGGIIFVMSLVGLVGIYKRSKHILYGVTAMIVFVIGLEIGVGASCSVMQEHVLKLITHSLRSTEQSYGQSPSASATWDSIQRNIECCGVDSYKEWYLHLNHSGVPDSCCIDYSVGCGRDAVKENNLFLISCDAAIQNWAHKHQIPSIVVYGIFVILQVTTIILTLYLQI